MSGSLMDPKEKENLQNKTKKDKKFSWKSKWLISDQQSNLYLQNFLPKERVRNSWKEKGSELFNPKFL